MRNNKKICVFDFETDGKNPYTCNPVQIGAVILNPRKLDIIAEFNSLMKPPSINDQTYLNDNIETIQWHAKKDKCTPEDIVAKWKKAPETKIVWKNFAQFVSKFHTKQTNQSSYTAPIPSGFNIVNFDILIVNRLCEKYGPVDTNGKPKIFSIVNKIDIMDLLFIWFENLSEPKRQSMDSWREFFGMSSDNAHDALQDVKDTTQILKRFLVYQRKLASVEKFKGALSHV